MSLAQNSVAGASKPAADGSALAVGREKLKGHLAMLLFTALASGSYSLGAIAMRELGASAANGVRFLIGVAAMMLAAFVLSKGRVYRAPAPWRFLVLGGLMAVFFVTMFMSLKLTSPVSSGAVFTLMPLMAALFGYLLLGQVPRKIVVGSLLFAAVGAIWVIFNGSLEALLAFDIGRGEIIFLVGVAAHALYSPMVKKLNKPGEPLPWMTAYTMLCTGILIAIYGFDEIIATDWASLSASMWGIILYLAIVTGAFSTFLVMYGSMKLPAAKVLAYTYLSPCFIIIFEGLLGHGWPSLSVAVGALIIVVGLIVMAMAKEV
ncbi:DMT family transporter [Aquamicrobium zhengzhouense]|nr:DMT family transporter [Aquamicrobium zhengzhouense]